MRIGLYIYKLGFGGAERVVCRTSQILQRKDHHVFIITDEKVDAAYDYAGDYINLDIPHNIHGFRSLLLFLKRIKALRHIKKINDLDVVISFLVQPNIVNILSVKKGCRCFVSIRNRFISENNNSVFKKLFFKLEKVLYKKADGVISVSNLINNEVIKYFNVPAEKSYTLYNPYDMETIISESKKTLDLQMGKILSDSTFKFVSTGRFTYQKGFWHLIKAFAEVHKMEPNTKLVLIGDGELKSKIMQLIKDLGIEDSVILPGFRKDVFSIESKCNVYVMTSLFEGFPNALTEAMCLGLPIITTDCKSGPKEILAPEMNLDKIITEPMLIKYGYLIPELETDENFESQVMTEAEIQLSNTMLKMIRISFDNTVIKERAMYFSEENYYTILNNIITP